MNNFHSKLVEATHRAVQEYYTFTAEQLDKINRLKATWNNEYYVAQLKEYNAVIMQKHDETKAFVNEQYKEFQKMIETKRDKALEYVDDYRMLQIDNMTERELNLLYAKHKDNHLFVGKLNDYAKEHKLKFYEKATTDIFPELLETYQIFLKPFITPFNASSDAPLKERQQVFDIHTAKGTFVTIDNEIAELL